ncbi:MAG: glycosyltransferase family A protein [Opitutaceae bacterium]
MTPLVSILIPAYNAGPWLGDSIGSALAQTHPRCEIIVVDDGSTDQTLAIARAFEARGVRVVTQANAGAAAARNRALTIAQGDYLQYLDADDLLSPGKIAAQLAVLAIRAPDTLATCRWGRFEVDPGRARFVDDAVFRDFLPVEYLLLHTRDARMIHPAAWLVPRAVSETAGPWNERLSLNDDGEYFARAVLASPGIAFCADPAALSYYRSGMGGSLSQRRSAQALASLELSVELIAAQVTKAEDSARTRRALADYWQRAVYELYPGDSAASARAAQHVQALGGSSLRPSMGARQRLLSRLIGWRLVRRLLPS